MRSRSGGTGCTRGSKCNSTSSLPIVLWSLSFLCFATALVKAQSDVKSPGTPFNFNQIKSTWDKAKEILGLKTTTPPPTTTTEKITNIPGLNCTPSAIDDFPGDIFTQTERQHGFVIFHFLAAVYIFYCLAKVCDDYFVPAIDCVCDEFQLPSDIAGASIMAMSTSSPELFTNIIGTFITQGDIGVGTIVGSAVFNILGVCACCGIAAKTPLPLCPYALTRDSLFYFVSVIMLIGCLGNRKVFWYESLAFVILYILYLFVMYKNLTLRKWTESLLQKMYLKLGIRIDSTQATQSELKMLTERTRLLDPSAPQKDTVVNDWPEEHETVSSKRRGDSNEAGLKIASIQADRDEEIQSLVQIPLDKGLFTSAQWIITWPVRFAFAISIPNCRESNLKKFYPITLLMCVVWIGIFTYLAAWTITVIGHTLFIPDSVMGLTFIAFGNSVPEAASSVIVARQGYGTMSISNSIGSNIFDILLCLGFPWLIRSSLIASEPVNYVKINSGGLVYSTMILLLTLLIFYGMLAWNRFYLDRRVGYLALILYALFLVLASLLEMNVFFPVNLPTCESKN